MTRHIEQGILLVIMVIIGDNLHALSCVIHWTLVIVFKVKVSASFIDIFDIEAFLSFIWIYSFLEHLFKSLYFSFVLLRVRLARFSILFVSHRFFQSFDLLLKFPLTLSQSQHLQDVNYHVNNFFTVLHLGFDRPPSLS